jgi:hypothetical protein
LLMVGAGLVGGALIANAAQPRTATHTTTQQQVVPQAQVVPAANARPRVHVTIPSNTVRTPTPVNVVVQDGMVAGTVVDLTANGKTFAATIPAGYVSTALGNQPPWQQQWQPYS